jgi:hypothetical protein
MPWFLLPLPRLSALAPTSAALVGAVSCVLLGCGSSDSSGSGGANVVDPSAVCVQYLACLDDLGEGSAGVETAYGPNGTCWKSTSGADDCTALCTTQLQQLSFENPSSSVCAFDCPDCGADAGLVGQHLLTFSIYLNPQAPVRLLATISGPEEGPVNLTVQPLDASDGTTPVGSPASGGPFEVTPPLQFVFTFPSITIPAEANPISGTEIVGSVSLTGSKPDQIICGTATGDLTEPFPLSLEGSTFTLQPITGTTYPSPVLDCEGNTP